MSLPSHRMPRLLQGALVLAVVAALALPAFTDDSAPADPKPAEPKPAAHPLGDAHTLMGFFCGEWEVKGTVFMVPGADGFPFAATSSFKWILGKRYLSQRFHTQTPQGPFEGHGTWAFDTQRKQWQSTWIDVQKTQIISATMEYDAATKTWKGSEFKENSPTGEMIMRDVTQITGPDSFKMTMHQKPAAGGEETVGMTLEYTRKK